LKHAFISVFRSVDCVASLSSSGMFVRMRASKFRIGGKATVRRVKGVLTLSHRWCCGDSAVEMDSIARGGVAAASAARRRSAFFRVRRA
jgi:hypothetical protein